MTITLIAVRHAEPYSDGHADETLRPLSKNGIATHLSITKQIKKDGYTIDQILTSPILRAKQTAEIMSDAFSVNIKEETALGYDFNSEYLLNQLSSSSTSTILVGHAPSLAEFVNKLVGNIVLPMGLLKSGAAVITFPNTVAFGEGKFEKYYKP